MKTTNYRASRADVRAYREAHKILSRENEKKARKREALGRLEVVCDMMRALMIKSQGIQLKDAWIYSLRGEKETHIKWAGYHVPSANMPVRAKRYSLLVMVSRNYSSRATEAEYSLTLGHKIVEGKLTIPGRKKR